MTIEACFRVAGHEKTATGSKNKATTKKANGKTEATNFNPKKNRKFNKGNIIVVYYLP